MKFLRAFIKNLAFVMLLITLVSQAALARCGDHFFVHDSVKAHAHNAGQTDDDHPDSDLTQCHISASDGFGGHAKNGSQDCEMANIDWQALSHPQGFNMQIDELTFLIKSLSLAPPSGPPKVA